MVRHNSTLADAGPKSLRSDSAAFVALRDVVGRESSGRSGRSPLAAVIGWGGALAFSLAVWALLLALV